MSANPCPDTCCTQQRSARTQNSTLTRLLPHSPAIKIHLQSRTESHVRTSSDFKVTKNPVTGANCYGPQNAQCRPATDMHAKRLQTHRITLQPCVSALRLVRGHSTPDLFFHPLWLRVSGFRVWGSGLYIKNFTGYTVVDQGFESIQGQKHYRPK